MNFQDFTCLPLAIALEHWDHDIERSFSSYNSILDAKRRNLNEQTFKAINFLNWDFGEESSTPQPAHEVTKKASCHLSTKLPCPQQTWQSP